MVVGEWQMCRLETDEKGTLARASGSYQCLALALQLSPEKFWVMCQALSCQIYHALVTRTEYQVQL